MKHLPLLAGLLSGGLLLGAASGPQAQNNRPLQLFFIDVEGGAATLTVTPGGESFLVDCGWPGREDRDPKRIQHVMQLAGLKQLDHYITSHWHTDHYGGIEGLAKLVPIKNYWDRGIPETLQEDPRGYPALIAAYKAASGGNSRVLKAGDTLPLRRSGGRVEVKVVAASGKVAGEGDPAPPISCAKHPAKPVDNSDNAQSIALHLKFGRFDFLNCGDLTWNIEHKLVCPTNRVGKIDLYQVTHHGMDISNNPAVLEAIEPRTAIMCNGPRKGGSAAVVRLLKETKSVEAFFQLHRNIATGPDDNAPPERIANLDENCDGQFLRVVVEPSGEYTVYKGMDQKLGTYRSR